MYQVIARKYRPQTFAELIGQEHVRTTLENAISQHRIAHGYIFSGQRGTGKTTIARIMARCLNCDQGPTSTPCGVCPNCLEIAGGQKTYDVYELDAASNRGINEAREIVQAAEKAPARGRFKIYIIDEAHQLTNEAFNALLKTLEEPPPWCVFILCTTESHKIPTTIASRCQQFSFRSVEFTALVERMQWICSQEGITADDEALAVLAQAGEGSVRDSLSALDQAIACCGNSLAGPAVRDLLGMYSLASLEKVTAALAESSTAAMLEIVDELERTGKNLQHFCRELARYLRNLLVASIAGAETRLIAASAPEQARLRDTAARFQEDDLTRWLQISLDIYSQLQYSLQPRLHLELGLLRLVHAGRIRPIEEALKELSPTPAAQAPPRTPQPPSSRPAPPSVRTAPPAPPALRTPSPMARPAPPPAEKPAAAPSGDLKSRLVAALEELRAAMSAHAVEASELRESPGLVEFIGPRSAKLGLMSKDIDKALEKVYGRPIRAKITITEDAAPAAASPAREQGPAGGEEAMRRALAHPDVQRFQELFPGSQVREVRDLKE